MLFVAQRSSLVPQWLYKRLCDGHYCAPSFDKTALIFAESFGARFWREQ